MERRLKNRHDPIATIVPKRKVMQMIRFVLIYEQFGAQKIDALSKRLPVAEIPPPYSSRGTSSFSVVSETCSRNESVEM
jgi:hypothetical protein